MAYHLESTVYYLLLADISNQGAKKVSNEGHAGVDLLLKAATEMGDEAGTKRAGEEVKASPSKKQTRSVHILAVAGAADPQPQHPFVRKSHVAPPSVPTKMSLQSAAWSMAAPQQQQHQTFTLMPALTLGQTPRRVDPLL